MNDATIAPLIATNRGRVLIADDDETLPRALARHLRTAGFDVECAHDGASAADRVKEQRFDVIISDINMPGMNGLQLLREVRRHDLDAAVVLITAMPAVDTAIEAVQYGAVRYLVKPVLPDELRQVVDDAVRLRRLSEMKRRALALLGEADKQLGDRAALEERFARGLASLWMAMQPIVATNNRGVYGYEALVRTTEPTLPHPGAFFDAAERLGRLHDLGRAIRAAVARVGASAPGSSLLFVNLHPRDLLDDDLFDPAAPLTAMAHRVVLEITERASLDEIRDARQRVARLRALGFQIAVDDLGAGYAGLTSFTLFEPQVVKLDMSLVRDVNNARIKRELIHSMTTLCHELGMLVVAEGVETREERDTLVDLGCDLLQGYLLARPGAPFPVAAW